MTGKEKLDLLWKYLLLAVIVYGIFTFGSRREHMMFIGHDMPDAAEMIMLDDIDLDLEKGDSTMVINVNGKVLTGEDALKWHDEHRGDMDEMLNDENIRVKVFIDDEGNQRKVVRKVVKK